jgi:hypothetical protein
MPRIISFGCSNTFGLELQGTTVYDLPSKLSYPSLLGSVNLAIPGASNKEIMLKILEIDFFKTDIVTILWTYPKSRTLLFHKKDAQMRKWQLLAGQEILYDNMNLETKQVALAWQKFNILRSVKDAMYDEYHYIKTANLYLQSCGCKVINMHCDDTYNRWTPKQDRIQESLYTKLNDVTDIFLKQDSCKFGHPGPIAHRKLSKWIKQCLNSL